MQRSVVQFVYLFVFNAPRPKSSYGVTAELTREQQRLAWQSMAQHQTPSELEAAAESTRDGPAAAVGAVQYQWGSDGARLTDTTASIADVLYQNPDGDVAGNVAMLMQFLDEQNEDTESAPESYFDLPHEADIAVDIAVRKEKTGLALPDPNDREAFDEYTDMITARDCLAVVARRDELRRACAYLEKQRAPNAMAEHRQLKTVRHLLAKFERRWGFKPLIRAGGGILALWCACTCGTEGGENERLESLVRAKVRRDVRTAYAWDQTLSELRFEAKERYLLELARFEMLTMTEQRIYLNNGGMALEDDPPPPRSLWKKVLCGVVMVAITLFACLYLLLFGMQQGKAMTKAWWVASMTGLALGAVVYEPFAIFVQFVLLPTTLRHKGGCVGGLVGRWVGGSVGRFWVVLSDDLPALCLDCCSLFLFGLLPWRLQSRFSPTRPPSKSSPSARRCTRAQRRTLCRSTVGCSLRGACSSSKRRTVGVARCMLLGRRAPRLSRGLRRSKSRG